MPRLQADTTSGNNGVEIAGWLNAPTRKLSTTTSRSAANALNERLQPVQVPIASGLQPMQEGQDTPLQRASVWSATTNVITTSHEEAPPLQPVENVTKVSIQGK